MLRFRLPERDQGLFSEHYVRDVLPTQKAFIEFDPGERLDRLEAILRSARISKLKEQAIEHEFLTGVFGVLELRYRSQPTIQGKEIDFAFYDGEEFREDFGNTTGICELKKRGRIERRYTVRKDDNSDPIAQIKFYLKEVNALLQASGSPRTVDFGVLTDGIVWRLYARFFTQGNDEFAAHFFEVRLDEVMACEDEELRHHHLKLFLFLFGSEGWRSHLNQVYQEAQTLAEAVSTGLREQVFTALELLATGLWRRVADPLDASHYHRLFLDGYSLDISSLADPAVRRAALRVVHDEAIVFLLRLLFLLYGEDRGLLPRVLKARDGLVDRIVHCRAAIGQLTAEHQEVMQDFDVRISSHSREIDRQYNGGIFSDEKHPLLRDLNIDNVLFANAIDHLCRVPLGKETVVVDFGSISVRELGTLYEGLLSYKLTEADRDELTVESIVDRKKQRFNLRQGDLYLVNQAGERKASGSYYTPDLIVRHLVERTLGKALDDILDGRGSAQEKLQAVLRLKVCDPAMGSGHFLVEAFDRLSQAVRSLAEDDEGMESAEMLRALIVRRCLYGVDLNPMAVEIAKMVLWIKTFRTDRPLEFFDANLKCGNSLVGCVEVKRGKSMAAQRALFDVAADWEQDVIADLSREVQEVLEMPSATIEQIRGKERRYRERVLPLIEDAAFIEHVRLLQHFHPAEWDALASAYDSVLKGIVADRHYLRRLLAEGQLPSLFPDTAERERVERLLQLVTELRARLKPVHWPIEFPHVFQQGGFDVVLGNPPWDTVTTDFRVFFSDYIPNFAGLETKDAKAAGEALCASNAGVAAHFAGYLRSVEELNDYVGDAYEHQVATDERGKRMKKGDNNLYKLFIERAWCLLREEARCGYVVPSGLNSDSGCTGLRQLLLQQTTLEELVMFENKRGIFPEVHRQYKFDVLAFSKQKPRKTHRFQAGFYWLDPAWLGGRGVQDDRDRHERFAYPPNLSQILAPDTLSFIEMRSAADIPILEKLATHPLLGDARQEWHGETYSEFHMTSDSDLFNTEGRGYPLFEGKCIHQYDVAFAPPTRWVVSGEGESRLSERWKCLLEELSNRQYRIGFRSIGRSTDSRTLIASLLPRFVFCGNSLNLLELRLPLVEQLGVLACLNSLTLDYVIRFRVSANVNAFYVKQLPLPRDRDSLAELGELARPLLSGRDFDEARGGLAALTSEPERTQRRAEIDARVARLYGLTYEELQHVTRQFPIVAKEHPDYMEEVLRVFRNLGGNGIRAT